MQSLEKATTDLQGSVADVMIQHVVAVLPKTSVVEVAELVAENNVRHAIVIDGDRKVLGVVSQRDLLKHFMQSASQENAPQADTTTAPWEVRTLIERKPVTVSRELPLAKAALVLSSCKICCLPVVDENGALVGSLSIGDLLRHLSGNMGPRLETQFQVFKPIKESRPKLPAFFRRSNGALVLPLKCLDEDDLDYKHALLGFDPPIGRILVRLVYEPEEGSRKIHKDSEQMVIPASDFVAHFEIKFHGSAFDISKHAKTGCLILTPKQASKTATPAGTEAAK